MDGLLCTGILSDVIQPKHCTHCIETEKKLMKCLKLIFVESYLEMKVHALRLVPVLSVNIEIEFFFYCIRKLGSLIVQKTEEKQRRKYCVWTYIFCNFKY